MNSIVVNYDPFGLESQILITREGETIGNTYCNSELINLAETVVRSAHHYGISRVYVRAPKVFYDELTNLVQAQEKISLVLMKTLLWSKYNELFT